VQALPLFLFVQVGHVHSVAAENGHPHVALVVVKIHLVFAMDDAGDGEEKSENNHEFIRDEHSREYK